MPNGKPGDHPITDILVHHRRVYSERADALVREIAALGGEREIADMLYAEYNEYSKPDVPKLERVLTAIRDRRLREAREKGWEV
jgi:hypothetical protein